MAYAGYDPAGLVGRLVEIRGVDTPVVPEVIKPGDLPKRPVFVDGSLGRAVWWIPESERYMVHLFDALYVALPAASLRDYNPPSPEAGGFDLAWPSHPEAYPDFAVGLSQVLEGKGWCCVQMVAGEDMREAAVEQALRHTKFQVLKQEFVSDYLGDGGKGKTGFLETEIPDVGSVDSLRSDPLSFFDRNLTNLAAVCAPIASDRLGFQFGDRTKAMLWLPYAGGKEESDLRPEPLKDEDVDEGLLEEHLDFLRRRRLCMMAWLDNDGGKLTLLPRPDLGLAPVVLPLSNQKLLVFKNDMWTFRYEPLGIRSVVLQSWMLAYRPPLQVDRARIIGEAEAKAEAMGIYAGRPHPQGDLVHVMAVHSRLPGGGVGADEYWSMLLEGTDGMGPIPFLRWDTDVYCTKEGEPPIPGKCYAHHGGFCAHEEIFAFDNKYFDISDHEAKFMSPGQRVVCEDGYTVLFKGGHSKESLSGRKVGVFLGDTGSDWQPFCPLEYKVQTAPGQVQSVVGFSTCAVTGANQSVTCSRLSHLLDMRGPVATADTACSSSLVATSAAMTWMRPREFAPNLRYMENRILETVAGGVCVQIGPVSYIGMCSLSMISVNGRCFTFDESGDGYARGEGVGLMYLRSSDEEEDRIQQCACLLSAQINQDGRSASMTAPNGPSQQACIQASMREAGNEARDLALAECHGTGTALGDPIEVGALKNAMEPRDTVLALTSSKSNIGHLEGGAGIAGLLKCILMLEAGTCPPNAHCRQLNPHLSVAGFPCYFDTEAIDTMLNSALTGVSSFGFGGTNGRCDIWGQAKYGVRKSGELNPQDLDQITVTCPITMGQIDHLSGEPLPRATGQGRDKYRADVLRDEFASYDISRYAYTGGFRYRRAEVPEARGDELPDGVSLYVCGSWSGYTQLEEMEPEEGGWYMATVALGEGCYELFDLCLNRDDGLRIYPAVHKAHDRIWIQGPDGGSGGQKWLIDGRDAEVPAGTVFSIHFKWAAVERLEIYWEQAGRDYVDQALRCEHTYFLTGDFCKWKYQPLEKTQDGWEGTFKIGAQCKSEFQLVRDRDRKQAVYPAAASSGPTSAAAQARGPDDLGAGKNFVVKGRPGDPVRVHLAIEDAKVTVTAHVPSKGALQWHSERGWRRHLYSAVGSMGRGQPIAMQMDPRRPGVFTCDVVVAGLLYDDAYGEAFQVAVDDDRQQVYRPIQGHATRSGQAIVQEPDGRVAEEKFVIRSLEHNVFFTITLDLTAEDKRKIVTWAPTSQLQIADGGR